MMRATRFAFVFAAIAIMSFSVAVGQGADVELFEFYGYGWSWDDEDTFLFFTTSSDFYCGSGEGIPFDALVLTRPDQSVALLYHGTVFARAYQPLTPDQFWADPMYYLCVSDAHVAEGIIQFAQTDNDATVSGNRANVWGWTNHGHLYSRFGICESGIAKLDEVKKWLIRPGADWPDCSPDCERSLVSIGPKLTCQ